MAVSAHSLADCFDLGQLVCIQPPAEFAGVQDCLDLYIRVLECFFMRMLPGHFEYGAHMCRPGDWALSTPLRVARVAQALPDVCQVFPPEHLICHSYPFCPCPPHCSLHWCSAGVAAFGVPAALAPEVRRCERHGRCACDVVVRAVESYRRPLPHHPRVSGRFGSVRFRYQGRIDGSVVCAESHSADHGSVVAPCFCLSHALVAGSGGVRVLPHAFARRPARSAGPSGRPNRCLRSQEPLGKGLGLALVRLREGSDSCMGVGSVEALRGFGRLQSRTRVASSYQRAPISTPTLWSVSTSSPTLRLAVNPKVISSAGVSRAGTTR